MIRMLILAAMVIPGLLCAETRYVSVSGSDSQSGTESRPFRTIGKGVKRLTPGDTLMVKAGTYAESLYQSIPSGTSWEAPVTVMAYPGDNVVLQPASGNRVLHFQSQQYIVVDGFVLDARHVRYDAIKITYGYTSPPAHHIRIMNCEVRFAPEQGILITGIGADGNEFLNLDVHDNGTTDHHHGIYMSTDRNLISDCTFYRNAGWGIHLYSDDDEEFKPDQNVVRNCRTYNNGTFGAWSVGIGIYSGSDNLVYNNLIWGEKVGVAIEYGASGTKLFNNVVYDHNRYGVYVGWDSANSTIRNNIVYGSGTLLRDFGQGTVRDHNLLNVDPRFVDPGNGDFRLRPDSPAIDAGAAIPDIASDIAGTLRPQGPAYDIGAYEMVISVDPRPKAPKNLTVVVGNL